MQQITMDDLLEPVSLAFNYIVGDKVKIHYYADVLEFVDNCFP